MYVIPAVIFIMTLDGCPIYYRVVLLLQSVTKLSPLVMNYYAIVLSFMISPTYVIKFYYGAPYCLHKLLWSNLQLHIIMVLILLVRML